MSGNRTAVPADRRVNRLAFWAWVGLMTAPVVILACWGVWALDAEHKSLWREAERKGEEFAEKLAKLPLPRDAVPRMATLPSADDETFFYPESPQSQPPNEAQQLWDDQAYERLLDGQYSGKLSAAGVPVGSLAAFALFRQATEPEAILHRAEQAAEMAIVRHPSALTATILAEIRTRLQTEKMEFPSASRWHSLLEQWQREEAVRRVLISNEAAILRQPFPTWHAGKSGEKPYWVAITRIDVESDKKQVLALSEEELRNAMQPRMTALLDQEQPFVEALYELYAHHAILVTLPEKYPYPLVEVATLKASPDLNYGVRIMVNPENVTAPLRAQRTRVWFTVLFSALALAIGIWRTHAAFQRQLELADQKDNFLSSVSHELRAPLGSVRLMAEGMSSGKLTAEERETFQHLIVLETQRLSSLVENLLDYARMEQGRRKYQLTDTNLTHLLRDTARSMEILAAARRVRFVIEADEIETLVDPLAIQQAVVNLLDNAMKFSPAGGTVHIALRAEDRNWVLSIQDEGPGVPAAEREKIFERFYRVGSELRRTTTGVGIGLSIVKHIVEGHAGKVVVDGLLGNCFRVIVPLRDQTEGLAP